MGVRKGVRGQGRGTAAGAAKKAKSDAKKAAPRSRTRGTPRLSRDPERAARLYDVLAATYPDAHCALDHRNAFELLAATILSAQCTDKRVNMVTPVLFERYPNPAAL